MTPIAVPPGRGNRERDKQYCGKCSALLGADEIGATKKLVNRGAERFFCLDCLAEAFEISKEDLEQKIRYFKEMGCTLFAEN